MNDPYQILGVGRDATEDELKRAYRAKCLEHHPDRNGDAEKFREVQEAYEAIGDPGRRAEYDRTGSSGDPTRDQQRAVANLVAALTAAADGELDMERADLVEAARRRLTEALRKCVSDGVDARTLGDKFRSAAERFTVRGLDDNPGRTAMLARAADCDRKQAATEAEERGLRGALEILSKMSYRTETGPGKHGWQTPFVSYTR